MFSMCQDSPGTKKALINPFSVWEKQTRKPRAPILYGQCCVRGCSDGACCLMGTEMPQDTQSRASPKRIHMYVLCGRKKGKI